MESNEQKINSWIFLVSANRNLDYRTVIAPDFLCKIKKTSIIARNAGGELTPYKVNYAYDQTLGYLTLAFRVIEAVAEDLGIEGNGTLKDSFGREIYLIEGLCFKGKIQDLQLSEDNFESIHNYIKPIFHDFWTWSTGKTANESYAEEYKGAFSYPKTDEILLETLNEAESATKAGKELVDTLEDGQKKKSKFFTQSLGSKFLVQKPLGVLIAAFSLILIFVLIILVIKIISY